MWKWILALIVIVAAGALAWKFDLLHMPPATAPITATSTPQEPAPVQSGLPTMQSDTSDAAIAQDSAAIDAQLTAMTQDSASIDQSLNDKPGTQSF